MYLSDNGDYMEDDEGNVVFDWRPRHEQTWDLWPECDEDEDAPISIIDFIHHITKTLIYQKKSPSPSKRGTVIDYAQYTRSNSSANNASTAMTSFMYCSMYAQSGAPSDVAESVTVASNKRLRVHIVE